MISLGLRYISVRHREGSNNDKSGLRYISVRHREGCQIMISRGYLIYQSDIVKGVK